MCPKYAPFSPKFPPWSTGLQHRCASRWIPSGCCQSGRGGGGGHFWIPRFMLSILNIHKWGIIQCAIRHLRALSSGQLPHRPLPQPCWLLDAWCVFSHSQELLSPVGVGWGFGGGKRGPAPPHTP